MTDFTVLPSNLPSPVDDGACDHLRGLCGFTLERLRRAMISHRGMRLKLLPAWVPAFAGMSGEGAHQNLGSSGWATCPPWSEPRRTCSSWTTP